jgi:hypothetical protein
MPAPFFGGPESRFYVRKPSGVFTSTMSSIFEALIRIRAHCPVTYLVLTDSMSFLKALQFQRVASKTHTLIYEKRKPILVAEEQ